jgi:putative two-component system hydrogenase maturation factor HypX/HoxX
MRKHTKNILLLTNAHNCMSQRLALELKARGHKINVQLAISESSMLDAYNQVKPDLVLCPFLTKKVPEAIYTSETPCIIVHPGIKGDRGISSLDWAVNSKAQEWGVTFLSAVEEMDAGPIWSSKNFSVKETDTKSYLYRTQVVRTAAKCLEETMYKLENGIASEPLDYSNPDVKGTLMPRMKDEVRKIDWEKDSLDTILRKIRCSDSVPGAIASLEGQSFRLFDPVVEELLIPKGSYNELKNGSVVGYRNGAVLVKTKDAPLWITHLKKPNTLKIPAMSYFNPKAFQAIRTPGLTINGKPKTFQDIWVNVHDQIATLNFNFLNGAMSTEQLTRLNAAINQVAQMPNIRVIVFRGGEDFFSNGINLNTIETAPSKYEESYKNINAINDCIKSIFSIKDKITVAYLEGNAGAGGAMMPLACDFVLTTPEVVLNPHYKSMGLYGSEYWTYWLTRRVGREKAIALTEECQPFLAREMVTCGMIDGVVHSEDAMFSEVEKMLSQYDAVVGKKQAERTESWFRMLETHRDNELANMRENFVHNDYQKSMKNFVFKVCPKSMVSSAHIIQDNPIKQIIDCKTYIEEKVKDVVGPKIKELKEKNGISPQINIIQVDDLLESKVYVERKRKTFEENGFKVCITKIDSGNSTDLMASLVQEIKRANNDEGVHGIIVQLPLPVHINSLAVLEQIHPVKNIDGFSVNNIGKIALSKQVDDYVLPCTVRGVVDILNHYDIKVQGKNFVVIGKGMAIGLPLSLYLMNHGATVTVCDRHTKDLKAHIQMADVIIGASSSHFIIDPAWLTPKSIVIDVGTKVLENKDGKTNIFGNLNGKAAKSGFFTPVPGGVGGTTVLMAMMNTLEASDKLIEMGRLAQEAMALEESLADEGELAEAEEGEEQELPDATAD